MITKTTQDSGETFWAGAKASPEVTGFPRARVMTGVFYGALMGAVYALVAGTVNWYVVRDLPVAIDWAVVAQSMALTAAAGAMLGGVTAYPADWLKGVVAGVLLIALVNVGRVLFIMAAFAPALTIIFVYSILPVAALSLPIAALVRIAVDQHDSRVVHAVSGQRLKGLALVLTGVILASAFAGSWSQMSPDAQEAMRKIDRMLQHVLAAPAETTLPMSLRELPDFKTRASTEYWMDQRQSVSLPNGIEVLIRFDSGLDMTCLVDLHTQVITCAEGIGSVYGGLQYNANDQR